ncbi:MAG: hypothetical protein ACE5HI_00690 [bacterium]
MKEVKYLLIVLIGIGFIVPGILNAQIDYNGGPGLMYVHSAWTLEPGYLTVTGHSRSFGKVANFPGNKSYTVWDVSGRINLNYGISKHFEVAATPILYQDTNLGGDPINTPDDFFFSVKIGSFTSPGSPLTYGVLLNAKIPTGNTHNVPFEPYSANRVGLGFMGLLTYSRDPLYPEQATNVHLNIGYWNHNDVGSALVEGGGAETEPSSMSQEILYGLGVKLPGENFDFSAELFGNAFIQSPPPVAYSRENYLYIAPVVTYKPYRWMTLSFGTDFRIISASDKTLYADQGGIKRTLPNSQPNYPAWRINMGTKFTILPTKVYRVNERERLMQKAQTRRELFEQIIKEQKETEAAEAELERIKTERLRAEKELERLRRILEGEATKSELKRQKNESESGNLKKSENKKSKRKEDNN